MPSRKLREGQGLLRPACRAARFGPIQLTHVQCFGRFFKSMTQALLRASLILIVYSVQTGSPFADYRRYSAHGAFKLSQEDKALLDDLEHRAFFYFWEQADPVTGLVRDRARLNGSPMDEAHRDVASIAATGFGLSVLCIGAERHWMPGKAIRDRVYTALGFFANRAPAVHGWFYHWMNAKTGERTWQSEISSIDTALLLAGVLTVRSYYSSDSDIRRLATGIYNRVDFKWMLNGDPVLLSHGWKPETGFLQYKWDTFSEDNILYLLAIGSHSHPIEPRSWYAWNRERLDYDGYHFIGGAPLFTHQYLQAWFDLRRLREGRALPLHYFENSVTATRANRAYCMNLSGRFSGYTGDIWGISASDSPGGYIAIAAPPGDPAIDGTVATSAAGGSLMFAPDICLAALKAMRRKYANKVWGRYGLADAFNPTTGWVDTDVIGIDLGIVALSAENLRTGRVWLWFSRNPGARRALRLAGFRWSR
ncbi:MAG: glucoamylase family protein [Blastocatellia bacterium]